ncbi:TLR4 interactor with leucine rich repeats-like [Callorhinchus milii]|uniref:TLR4 interactor with leucine rich repeats-like n=1 Tax=Callorhinchus milii TaxID=7868 RepID=UPI00045737C6|nr:TLR4 interactor with leucine rich repeats-like [Callorhinchus milii]|eukprot:gi/632946126/ref/XP_007888403.1/ PREDICTED: TLR4 interactor with leucine rich repeats-like [Callorhinchus milii]
MAKSMVLWFTFLSCLKEVIPLFCPDVCECHDETLICTNRGLKSVPQPPQGLSSAARALSLGGNFITHLSPGDFCNYPALKELSLQYNSIQTISSKTFVPLTELKELYLGNNLLSSLENKTFAGLNNIQLLDLNRNRLSHVSRDTFYGLNSLIKLRLDGNVLSTIPDGAFVTLGNLGYLHLEKNNIRSLWRNPFRGLGKLRYLNLSKNNISLERGNPFRHLKSLSELQLSENRIVSLREGAFRWLTELTTLSLSHNTISDLDHNTFQGLTQLRSLALDSNNITVISQRLFSPVKQIQDIDLSRNAISEVQIAAFWELHLLNSLNLKRNALTGLDPAVFASAGHLYKVDLSDNPWECDCHLMGLRDWIHWAVKGHKLLTVFIRCDKPQSLSGRYLDLLSDQDLINSGGECPTKATQPTSPSETHPRATQIAQDTGVTELDSTQAEPSSSSQSSPFPGIAVMSSGSKGQGHGNGNVQPTPTQRKGLSESRSKATMRPRAKQSTPAKLDISPLGEVPQLTLADSCRFNRLSITNLSTQLVTSSSATLTWDLEYARTGVSFRIMYDRFNQNKRFSRYIYVKEETNCYTLQDLYPSVPYLICLESVVDMKTCEMESREHCLGILTKAQDSFPVDTLSLILYVTAANGAVLVLVLVLLICTFAAKHIGRRRADNAPKSGYCSVRKSNCAACSGITSQYNSSYQSTNSGSVTPQPNCADCPEPPQRD